MDDGDKNKNSRNYGHKAGLETVEKIINASIEKNIKFLTLYAIFNRKLEETHQRNNYLFHLLNRYLNKEIDNLLKQNIKIKNYW